MKEFSGKTLDDALAAASEEQGVAITDLVYTVEDEKRGLFSKKVIINVYELPDVIEYAENYLLKLFDSLGIESTATTKLDDDVIRITIDSTHNPILIGRNGRTLQSLNDLVKVAVGNHFKKRFRILLDINGYKDSKYDKVTSIAKRVAKQVQRTKIDAILEPMPADERRMVHNALNGMPNIRTESTGEGTHRQVQIIYVPGDEYAEPVDDGEEIIVEEGVETTEDNKD